MVISRTQFRDLIEAGIRQLPMTPRAAEAKRRLREVAETAQDAAVGTFVVERCDGSLCRCPAAQAGLTTGADWAEARLIQHFYSGYDKAALDAGLTGSLVIVVD